MSVIIFLWFKNALKCFLDLAKSCVGAISNTSIDKDSLDPVGGFHVFNMYKNKKKAEVVGIESESKYLYCHNYSTVFHNWWWHGQVLQGPILVYKAHFIKQNQINNCDL